MSRMTPEEIRLRDETIAAGSAKRLPYDAAPAELKPTLLAIAKLEHAARTALGDSKKETAA